ncbi:hypothetical protein COLO4_16605 [Corchorus olitorius]|uniref:DUF7734 domain-containing protein n=1 Tax=Corchorus olitorius TaxID=93759 RepID=A0A1R3JGK2_9ROSI|nr:hypothetical protein COLO4_16605 [Corchorus olitorius]
MASLPSLDHHPGSTLDCKIFRPERIFMEPHEPPPISPQVEVTISLEIRLFHHYCSSNRLTVVDNHLTVFPRQTLRFDAHVFQNQQLASMFLGSMLTSLGLFPEYPDFHFVIDKIMPHGLEISNFIITSELIEPVVLGLRVELQQRVVLHIDNQNGSDLTLGRAIEESELDFERLNYGMVPAEESSVKKELKKGFSSSLTYGTSPDPSRSVIPARAIIKSIDRIKGPFDPSNIEYIEKGLEWESFKTRLAPT